ncbi:MAG: 16S rRNA (adenine(1518)-N(6)/adenine(1519)-N(6))-dimethyltransferase RsmA [Phycisphaerae bacterium]|nr:16S rRNA (adenine(1518)-N(6)/adenine(1519)-N(6))-dimethyltransferase RsmA [Phycisphaerae bacterium]
MFQTQREIRSLLSAGPYAPRKRFGQHFLIDRNLMYKLVDAAEIGPRDVIIEVGAGTGSLTGELASRAQSVIAVEIDRGLAEIAKTQNAARLNIEWLVTDALESKARLAPPLAEAIHRAAHDGRTVKLVANLPYDIATPLVLNLLCGEDRLERLCFTVQKEVGERFLASPRTSAYGVASIVAQGLAVGHRIARVPPEAFWPAPKVESSMIALTPRAVESPHWRHRRALAELARQFFNHRRKTLQWTAAKLSIPDFDVLCSEIGIDPALRPEAVSVDRWLELARAGPARKSSP